MSEAIPGMPPAPEPDLPKKAAVVVLVRERDGLREVFWLRRRAKISFGGFYAFPGGKLDPDDARIPVEGATGEDAVLRAAAARELFEETGILLAQGAEALDEDVRNVARLALNAGGMRFSAFLSTHGLRLMASDFEDAGRWITPPWVPTRVDAHLFTVQAPHSTLGDATSDEHTDGAWIRPADGLARWEQGTALLHPPNLHVLKVFAGQDTWSRSVEKLRTPTFAPGYIASRIEFQGGVRVFPLETPTLPPAAHTNTYVLGTGELLIVDPGSREVRQYSRLIALVTALISEGMRVKAIVVTHHHDDHIGGAFALRERLKAPLWCHAATAEHLAERFGTQHAPPERLLKDGDVLTLSGLPTMRWRVVHTPGHARGHICLYDQASRAVIAGDMIAGLGSIVIDPPEGDMAQYLASLRLLRALPAGTVYPAHGPPIAEGIAKIDEYIRHREDREKKVFEALDPKGALLALPAIVTKAYDDTPEFLHPLAERSALAILLKLEGEGRVARLGETFARAG